MGGALQDLFTGLKEAFVQGVKDVGGVLKDWFGKTAENEEDALARLADADDQVTKQVSEITEPRYAMGNASGPTGARPADFRLPSDAPADTPLDGLTPEGAKPELPGMSVFKTPEDAQAAGLTGKVWEIPPGELPEGMGIQDNGIDVGGDAPYGHSTIYPTEPTTVGDFRDATKSLPHSEEPVATINKKGNLTYTEPGAGGTPRSTTVGDDGTKTLTDGSTLAPQPDGSQVRTLPDGRRIMIPPQGSDEPQTFLPQQG